MNRILFVAVLISTGWLTNGCDPAGPPKAREAVAVLTAQAAVTNVPVLIDPPPVGHVTPVSCVTIRSQVGGTISSVNFQEGQEVKVGDLLFTIDARPMQAALEQARANLQRDRAQLENSKIQFDREQKLFGQKLVSQDEYDTAHASLDALTGTVAADAAALTNADLNVEYTRICSPIEGRTGALQFHQGNVVKAPDDTLVNINQIRPIYTVFSVPERYLPVIQRQARSRTLTVSATYDNMDEETNPPEGEVTFVDNTVDPTTGMIQLRATFANARSQLWPGQFVSIALQLDELTNVVVIPSRAVQTGQGGPFTYVVKPDKTVESRTIKTSMIYHGLTVVTSGLSAGETVVTDGQLRLANGVLVNDKTGETAGSTTNPPVK